MRMRVVGWLMVALMWVLSACSNFGQYMEEGDRAFALEDYASAITSYKKALKEDPESVEAKQALELSQMRHFDVLDKEARTALKAREYVKAIQITQQAVALVKETDERSVALKQEILTVVTRDANNAIERGRFADALSIYEELLQSFPNAIPDLPELIDTTRFDWSMALADEAKKAESQGLLGVALLHWSKAIELSQNRDHERARARVFEDLKKHHRFNTWVQGQKNNSTFSELSFRLSQTKFGPGMHLVLKRNEFDPLDAYYKLEFGKIDYDKASEKTTEFVRYQKGTREVETQDYKNGLNSVESHRNIVSNLEHELGETENLVASLESVAEPGKPDDSKLVTAKKKRRQIKEDLVIQRKELTKAENELAGVQRYATEPIYADLEYPLERHTYTAKLKMRAALNFTTNIDPLNVYSELKVEIVDVIHSAYPDANLQDDPPEKPSIQEMEKRLYDQGFELLSATLNEGYQLHLEHIRKNGDTAASDSEQLNFYVIFSSLQTQPIPQDVIDRMASISGIPNAVDLVALHVPPPAPELPPEEPKKEEPPKEDNPPDF